MSEAKVIEDHRVVCCTTVSLREILKLYSGDPYTITLLESKASNFNEDTGVEVTVPEYGFEGCAGREMDFMTLNYRCKFDKQGNPRNPLDKPGRIRIENAMDKLDIRDAAVSRVRVLIRDPKIGELAGMSEDQWHMTLISDPVDSEKDEEIIKEHPINEELIKECKFKYRILHLRELIDRRQELTIPKAKQVPVIRWWGETAISLVSPKKLAQYLKDSHFGEYKLWKLYGQTEEERLVLLSVSR